jgi:hypothetical protein
MIIMSADQAQALDIKGCEQFLRGPRNYAEDITHQFPEEGVSVRLEKNTGTLTFRLAHGQEPADSLVIDMTPVAQQLVTHYGNESTGKIPPGEMTITAADQSAMVRVFVRTLRIQRRTGKPAVQSFDGEIAYTRLPR